MSIDYILITNASMDIVAEKLPDATNWREFDGLLQYQGSSEFIINMCALSKQEYRPPWRARWQMGSEYDAASISQEGGSTSDSVEEFLREVFEALSGNCEKVAVDSPAGFFWFRR